MSKKQNKKAISNSKKPKPKKSKEDSDSKNTASAASSSAIIINTVAGTEGDSENKEISPDTFEEIIGETAGALDDEMDLKDDDDMDDEGEDWE